MAQARTITLEEANARIAKPGGKFLTLDEANERIGYKPPPPGLVERGMGAVTGAAGDVAGAVSGAFTEAFTDKPEAEMTRWQSGAETGLRSAGEVVASLPQQAAVARQMPEATGYAGEQAKLDEARAAAENIRSQLESGVPHSQQAMQALQTQLHQYEQDIARLSRTQDVRAQTGALDDPRQSTLYRAGETAKEALRETLPGDPAYKGEFFAETLPGAGGSAAGFVLTGAAGRAIGLPATMMAAYAGSALNGSMMFEEALNHGADLDTAYKAFAVGSGLGLSEAVPIAQALRRLDQGTGGALSRTLKGGFKGGIEEAVQEVGQQVGQNAAARALGYDPERGTWEGAGEGGAAGAIVGMLFGGGVSGMGARRPSQAEIEASRADPTEALRRAPEGGAGSVTPQPVGTQRTPEPEPQEAPDVEAPAAAAEPEAPQVVETPTATGEAPVASQPGPGEVPMPAVDPETGVETPGFYHEETGGWRPAESQAEPPAPAAVAPQPGDEISVERAEALGQQGPIAPDLAQPTQPIPTREVSRETAVEPDGQEIPVRLALVEADDLIASQTDDMRDNPLFPQELQPRDRTRASSIAQVRQTAGNLNPRLLSGTPLTSEGAPIVSPDGVVESGNGRTLAIRTAYNESLPGAERYREFLEAQGYDTSGMNRPVLVRIRDQEMTPDERMEFVRKANQRTTASMSAAEQARSDAQRLSPDLMSIYQGGDIDAAANRRFVRSFVSQVVPESERGAIIDAQGQLSQEGARRINNALLAGAYQEPSLTALLTESQDNNIAAIGKALTQIAPQWQQMRAEAAAGQISPNMDVTDRLMEAVNIVRRARDSKRNVKEFIPQGELFSGQGVSREAELFLHLFHYDNEFSRPVRNGDVIAKRLSFYVGEARKTSGGPDLLGPGGGGVTPGDILQRGVERATKEERSRRGDDGLFERPGRAERDGQGDDADGQRRAAETRPRKDAGAGERTQETVRRDQAEPRGRSRVQTAAVGDNLRALYSLTPEYGSQRERLRREVQKLLDRLAPGTTANVAEVLAGEEFGTWGEVYGAYTADGEPLGLIDHIVSISMNAPDPLGTARHEVIHFLREVGYLEDIHWNALMREAPKWRKRFDIDRLYPDFSEDIRNEEAVAEAYAAWARGEQFRGPAGRVLRRIGRFFDQVREAVRSVLGKDADWRDVFSRIERGKVQKGRAAPQGTTQTVKRQRASASRRLGIPQQADPPIQSYRDMTQVRGHADYRAAKAGDVGAAARLVEDLVAPESLAAVRERFGPDTVFAPVRAEEASGDNAIPEALAYRHASEAGAEVSTEIVQANRAHHTGAKAAERMLVRPLFAGPVVSGAEYVIVDDVTTMGGTLAEMANHIRTNGGEVAGVITLVNSSRTPTISAPANRVREIERRFGDAVREIFGLEPASLTAAEAFYLLNFRDADGLRTRAASAARQREERLLSKGIRPSSEGGEGLGPKTKFQRARDNSNLFTVPVTSASIGQARQLNDINATMLDRLKAGASWQTVSYGIDLWRTQMQDRFLPLKRVQQAIERETGKPLREQENAYLAEEGYTSKAGERLQQLEIRYVEPLLRTIHEAGLDLAQVEDYLYARHAKERNAHISKINPAFQPGEGSGMTDAEADGVLRSAHASPQAKTYQQIGAMVDAISALTMQTRVELGLMSSKDAKKWQDTYKHYVPLKGVREIEGVEGRTFPRTGKGYDVRGAESKRATGRKTPAKDLLSNLVMQAEEAIIRGEKNQVGQAMLNLASNNPSALWDVDKIHTRAVFNKTTGLVEYQRTSNLPPQEESRTLYVKVDGEMHRITFNDDRLAKAMRGLDADQHGAIIRSMMALNRFLSAVNTGWNPEFVISNAIRDAQTAGINLQQFDVKKLARTTFRDYPKALRGALGGVKGKEDTEWQQYFREFARAGGKVSFFKMDDVDAQRTKIEHELDLMKDGTVRSAKRAFRSVFKFVEQSNQAVDNAVRLSAFVNARRAGMTDQQAATLAKNLTVNFNRRGQIGPQMNALYLFYNAGIQGTAVMFNAIRSRRVRRILYGIVALGFAMEYLNQWLSPEDDDGQKVYDKLPDYEKQRNFIVMMPWENSPFIKFPLPYGYNVPFVMGREVGALSRGRQPADRTLGNIALSMLDSFNPIGGSDNLANMLSPTITDPFVDVIRNENFMGTPIMPVENPFDTAPPPESQRYFNSVSPVTREVTRILNEVTGGNEFRPGYVDISPEVIDHVLMQFTGASGAFFQRALVELPVKIYEGDEIEVRSIPFVRRLLGEKGSWIDTGLAYDRMERIDQDVAEMEGFAKSGQRDKAREALRENQNFIRLRNLADGTRKALSNLRKAQQATKAAPLTEEERDKRLEAIEARREAVVTRFNRAYLEAQGAQQ